MKPRWYAPVMKHPWGKPMSHRAALILGVVMSVAAIAGAAITLADDDLGPIDTNFRLFLSLFWAWLAWSLFAHAFLHASRQAGGREGGA